MRRLILGFILLLLTFIIHFPALAFGSEPVGWNVLWLEPVGIILGPDYCVGETFTLAAKIDADKVPPGEGIIGFGLQITWNTAYLEYVNHSMMVPVEEHPGGILHEPVLIVADVVDEVWGTYDCATAALGGAPFSGIGTAFEITFIVIDQPEVPEADIDFWIFWSLSDVGDPVPMVPWVPDDCHVIIHAYEETPPSPPVGGTSVSIDLGKFSNWVTSTLLLVTIVITLNMKRNRRGKKH